MFHGFLLTFVGIFVALDIVGTLPLYLSMTQGMTPNNRRNIVDRSLLIAFLVALVFLFFGNSIFRYLGIEVLDFKIAGGVVLILVSLADLLAGPEGIKKSSGSTGIVPLAVPLITGPGLLTTIILQVANAGYVITLSAVLLNFMVAWFLLRRADRVTALIGKDGTVVVSKLAALLLAAIAVSMIRSGVFDAIHQFR